LDMIFRINNRIPDFMLKRNFTQNLTKNMSFAKKIDVKEYFYYFPRFQ
jgi:hypothetical protein